MKQPTPKELLQSRLFELEKALQKSFKSYQAGMIDQETHLTHKGNLEPAIFKYKQALNLLEGFEL